MYGSLTLLCATSRHSLSCCSTIQEAGTESETPIPTAEVDPCVAATSSACSFNPIDLGTIQSPSSLSEQQKYQILSTIPAKPKESQLSEAYEKQVQLNTRALLLIIDSIQFLVKQGLGLRGSNRDKGSKRGWNFTSLLDFLSKYSTNLHPKMQGICHLRSKLSRSESMVTLLVCSRGI